jgi:hypothetical protein
MDSFVLTGISLNFEVNGKANNLIFTKEFHMRCFNDYLRSTFDSATNFVLSILSAKTNLILIN